MRCNTTMKHFTSSKEMLNKNGVVPLTIMGLQHSNSRQEKHKQLKHMRLRFVTGRNVPSHTEFINTWPNRLASSSCNRNHGTVCAEKTNLTADPSSSFLLLLPPHPCGFHVYQPKVPSQENTEALQQDFLFELPVQALQRNPGRLQNNKTLYPYYT